MGGSRQTGGQLTANDLDELRKEAQQRLAQSHVESEVNSLLHQELTSINDRDVERTNDYLDSIEQALGEKLEYVDRLLFGGSVAKHTYVDGLSDVDALVLIRGTNASGTSPSEMIGDFADALRQSLPRGNVLEVREGNMAVTIQFRSGTEIQLLPSLDDGGNTLVASRDGKTWSSVQPQRFARELTEANRNQRGGVIPAIKLAKAIFAGKPTTANLSGYHVEALAVNAFRNYTGPNTPKAMLTHLVEHASRGVLRPIRDVTGQSRNVDDSLGVPDSSARRAVARELKRLSQTMKSSQSAAEWRTLLG